MSSPEESQSRQANRDPLDGLSDEEIVRLVESEAEELNAGQAADGKDLSRRAAKARRGLDLIRRATGKEGSVAQRLQQLIGAEWAGASAPSSERLAKFYSKGTPVAGGRYRLESLIGEGGMGMVWVAEQREPVRRRVALKLIKPGMDSRQVLQRFEAERQALAAMDHPNIARVFDGGLTDREHPFFVMELVNGANLTTFCDEAQLTVRERLEIFCQIAQAIQHAHHKGVLHRDLKPANILVTLIDGKPVPKIIDFGLAKVLGSQSESAATGFGMVVGTVEYMSPEQAGYSGQDVDTRADIYSLGVILYELLTGLRPFDSERMASAAIDEVLRMIKTEEPLRPSIRLSSTVTAESNARVRRTEQSKLSGLLRKELDWVVMKALEKDRNRRYDSAKVFAEDIQRYLAGEPVSAHPPSITYRLGKFVGKHRLAVLFALVVLLALLISMAGIVAGYVKARQSEQVARKETQAKEKALIEMRDAQMQQDQARRQALRALRSMTDEFMGAEMARETDLSMKDQTYLKNIIRQFDAFSDTASEDQEGRTIRADARVRVGRIYSYLGDPKTAESHLREALQLWTQLVNEQPAEGRYRSGLASCQRLLGSVLMELGQNQEADQLKRDSLDYWRQRAETSPSRQNQISYAYSLMDVAGSSYRQLKFDEAEQLYLEAIQIWESFDRNPANRERLASSLNGLATVYDQMGQSEKSREARERSMTLRQRNVRRFSARTEFKEGLARSLIGNAANASSRSDWTEAARSFREAQQIYQGLVEQYPSMLEYRIRSADCLSGLAGAYAEMHRRADVISSLAKEVELRESLLEELEDRMESRSTIAGLQYTLGRAYDQLNEVHQAESKWLDAIRTREQLLEEFPEDQANASALAVAYQSLAHLQQGLGRIDESLANIEAAVRLRREVVTAQAGRSGGRRQLAGSLRTMASILNNFSRSAEAKPAAEEAREILEELRQKHPEDLQTQTEYLHTLLDLAMIQVNLRDSASAGVFFEKVKQINEQDLKRNSQLDHHRRIRRRFFFFLIQHLAAQHQNQQALDAAKQLRELGWDPARESYYAACALAQCLPMVASDPQLNPSQKQAHTQELVEAAMDFLRQAIQMGYGGRDVLDRDRDLEPLRQRPDFQELMGSLEWDEAP